MSTYASGPQPLNDSDKNRFYRELDAEIASLLSKDWFTNLSNASACLKFHLRDVNWAGFYLARGQELLLGPFQGLPACLSIRFGKGVCGTSAANRKTLLVPDVDQFPGHIACDSASRSEIVVPLVHDGRLLGVMDVDSPLLSRFDDDDQKGLEAIANTLVSGTNWPQTFV